MADVNVNAPADQAPTMAPPTRTDDQIMPHIRWVPIGKSNCYFDVEKSQSNPIYKITVDILKHTNFFRAFTTSSTIPSIYIQQFWDTVRYDKTTGCYKCQLDEQWFDLTKDTLRDALQITPVNNNKAFSSPPSSDALINFVNELGYSKLVRNLSNVRKHKFHPRPDSPLHLPNEELVLGYLKFSAKGSKREVFRMPIPDNLITADIQAKSQGKKRKLVTELSDKPSPPRKSKPGLLTKRRKPTSSLRSIDDFVAEGIPEKEPRVDDEEADVQRAFEESLKSIYDVPWGPLPLVVIREPESGKYQPLPEVQGKGKEKVTEEHVTRDLLTLQTPKKKSPTDQYIFQRRTSTPIGSSGHDESSSLYAEFGLMDSEVESDKDVSGIDAGVQDVSTQPHPEQMDEGFTATAYLKVQENLKLTVEKQVILEEPASSTGTLSSLQHLTKDLSFGDLFFIDKPLKADNEKTTVETEAESMILHQRMWETNSYKTHEDHMMLYEALEKSMNCDHSEELLKDLAKARRKKKKRCDSPKMPPGSPRHQLPPPSPPTGPSGASGSPGASRSSQVPPPPPPPPSTNQEL
uniref:Monodehydroascorbate reductase n=1 Tax=Tanacetum cinerariifolium TaxID=118510 RepID=A0A6L2MDU1_TANCI|nr:monodehydroascorbate reductase [Tanacetum cinerariifolium]